MCFREAGATTFQKPMLIKYEVKKDLLNNMMEKTKFPEVSKRRITNTPILLKYLLYLISRT